VFTYRCPACGKHHVTETAFEQDFQAKCLRCGEPIHVTEELVHPGQASGAKRKVAPALESAITKLSAKDDVSAVEEEATIEIVPNGATKTKTKAKKRASVNDTLEALQTDLEIDGSELEITEVWDSDNEGDSRPRKSQPKRKSKKADKNQPRRGEEKEEDEEDARPMPKSAAQGSGARWAIIIGVAAVVLVGAGVGGYFLFSGKKGADSKTVASNTKDKNKKSTSKTKAKDKAKPAVKDKDKGKDKDKDKAKDVSKDKKVKEPDVPPPPKKIIYVSAPRLSAELAANAEATNQKYAGATLEVSGLFQKVEVVTSDKPPACPHFVFAVSGKPVRCEMQSPGKKLTLIGPFMPNRPYTVRGVYGKDGFLHDGEACPLTSSADAMYKDKEIEVIGFIEAVNPVSEEHRFPTIQLECGTSGRLQVHCLFRKTDEGEVKKFRPGALVTVRGVCGGRESVGELYYRVRIDNCQIVYTTAPPAPIRRIEVARLASDYEEDLRPEFLPPGAEGKPIKLTVSQLAMEVMADKTAAETKYRNKVLILSGKLKQKFPREKILLESGDTNKLLQVQCHFTPRHFAAVDESADFIVRGICAGMIDPTTMRMDDCERYDPKSDREIMRITADFLPHVPGKSYTFDLVSHLTIGKKKPEVIRQAHSQEKNGLTEVVTTHSGILLSKSLLDEGEPEKWFSKAKRHRVPGANPSYYRRLSGGVVELGRPQQDEDGKLRIIWEPVLKLGAKEGDTWTWTQPDGEREYKVVKLDVFRGVPRAVVHQTVVPIVNPLRVVEIESVYLKGYGEVARREWLRISSKQKHLILEKVMAERTLSEDPGVNVGPPAPPMGTSEKKPPQK
jgi:hypothetical protein